MMFPAEWRMAQTGRGAAIARLKSELARLERPAAGGQAVPLGLDALDTALPGGGLGPGVHEIGAADYRDRSGAVGFCLGLAVRLAAGMPGAALIWCQKAAGLREDGALYGPGLAAFGLDPDRLVIACPKNDREMLWTLEEALRSGAPGAVIGEIDGAAAAYDLTATRRLQLAAEEAQVPLLMLTGQACGLANAALTRWRVGAAPAADAPYADGIGAPRWRIELVKCRGGRPRAWRLEWRMAERRFALVTPSVQVHPSADLLEEARVVAEAIAPPTDYAEEVREAG